MNSGRNTRKSWENRRNKQKSPIWCEDATTFYRNSLRVTGVPPKHCELCAAGGKEEKSVKGLAKQGKSRYNFLQCVA